MLQSQNSDDLDNLFDQFGDDDFNDVLECYESTDENIPKPCLETLKRCFGHTSFRSMQWKVISSVMNDKRDNCVVMATGYGKSLCYQFPSVHLNSVTVVVSPLISLMEDQVLSLTLNNINACLLGTAQKDREIFTNIFNFEYNLIYCTPEFLTGDFGSDFLNKLSSKLSLIAIDEAHCISKWGHDFRSAFRYLGKIRKIVPQVPILAMTATATEEVRQDICRSLNLRNPQLLCTGFDRPNLEFHVKQKSNFGIWNDIGIIIKSVRIGSIIIYCLTRQITENITEILQKNGVKCLAYHAGLTINQRNKVHNDFVKDNIQVIVATIAFGMGIDKPDVRMVIHYGVSKDVESYYQEVGRAGRDGMPAKCFMFYSRTDWNIHEVLREKSNSSSEMKTNLRNLSMKMKEYVNIIGCRREFIIQYFEGTIAKLKKNLKSCCDNCNLNRTNEKLCDKYENCTENGLFDFSKDAENLFLAIEVFNGYKGLMTVILFLRGAKRQTLNEKYYSHPLFGIAKSKTEEWHKAFADLIEAHEYIEKKSLQNNNKFGQKNKFYYNASVIAITQKAKNWLNDSDRKPILLQPDKSMLKFMKRKDPPINSPNLSSFQNQNLKIDNLQIKSTKDDNTQLYRSLMQVRSAISRKMDVMPYMVMSNKAIHQLIQKCPLSLDELKSAKLDGFSDVKANKIGNDLIKCILEHKHFLPTVNSTSDSNVQKTLKDYLMECPLPNAKPLTDTFLITYELFKAGKSLNEIIQERHLATSTVVNYFSELIKNGLVVSKIELRRLGVADYNFKLISEKIKFVNTETIKLTEIKELLPPTVTYDNIKLVLSYYQLRNHIKKLRIPFEDPDERKENVKEKSSIEIGETSNENLISEACSSKHFTSQTNTTEKMEQEQKDSFWDSDDDLDFDKVDADVKKAEQTINKSEIIEINDSCDSENNKTTNNKELELLLQDIENEKQQTSQESQKSDENPLKRKAISKKKSAIIYLEDSSSDEEKLISTSKETKTKKLPQAKRRVPDWMMKAKD